jgi:hypothetical protein
MNFSEKISEVKHPKPTQPPAVQPGVEGDLAEQLGKVPGLRDQGVLDQDDSRRQTSRDCQVFRLMSLELSDDLVLGHACYPAVAQGVSLLGRVVLLATCGLTSLD